ncbi:MULTISPECIES: hypothetical protein [unclassified Xanthobacter]|uniref:hypothetical protein n=1 Tax=unclassified Xanthobacter TaxID=2623496 RepID=UPI001F1AD901|nr:MULTISPECIES: hypothetical protein [unclassified Xanthobacter]
MISTIARTLAGAAALMLCTLALPASAEPPATQQPMAAGKWVSADTDKPVSAAKRAQICAKPNFHMVVGDTTWSEYESDGHFVQKCTIPKWTIKKVKNQPTFTGDRPKCEASQAEALEQAPPVEGDGDEDYVSLTIVALDPRTVTLNGWHYIRCD